MGISGISITEFRVAMETYGAKKGDRAVERYLGPCFSVGDVKFLHSGSYYIVLLNTKAHEEIMNRAMVEFGEKDLGEDDFWWGKIHSVRRMLTIASMLEGKYSKELIDELANTTYKKLLECALSSTYVEPHFQSNHSPKIEKLCKKLAEYNSVVNPFGSDAFKLKEPIEYLDSTELSIEYKEGCNPYVNLRLNGKSTRARYYNNPEECDYNTRLHIQRNRKRGYISLGNCYTKGSDQKIVDEVVRLYYKESIGNFDDNPDDIDLRISLKTGMAWITNKESQASPATDEQINLMITHLNICIKKIKREIIRYMTDNQA